MKFIYSLATLLLACTTNSLACDNHYGPNFGAFGQFHPMSQRQTPLPDLADLKVFHSSEAKVKTNKEEKLELSYFVPLHYTGAEVTLSASDDIIISEQSPLALSETRGQFNLSFRAKASGKHYILVKIRANKSNSTLAKVQRISIVAS